MFGSLISWLTSAGVSAVGDQLNRAYENKLNATSTAKRIEADVTIEQLTARERVLRGEQSYALTRWIRPAAALPVVIYIWKLFVWDSVLGWGSTPEPGVIMTAIISAILGAYFLVRPFEKRGWK